MSCLVKLDFYCSCGSPLQGVEDRGYGAIRVPVCSYCVSIARSEDKVAGLDLAREIYNPGAVRAEEIEREQPSSLVANND